MAIFGIYVKFQGLVSSANLNTINTWETQWEIDPQPFTIQVNPPDKWTKVPWKLWHALKEMNHLPGSKGCDPFGDFIRDLFRG